MSRISRREFLRFSLIGGAGILGMMAFPGKDNNAVSGRIECRATDGVGPGGLPTAQCYGVDGVPFDYKPEIDGVIYQPPFVGTETVDMNEDGKIDQRDGAVFTVHESAG